MGVSYRNWWVILCRKWVFVLEIQGEREERDVDVWMMVGVGDGGGIWSCVSCMCEFDG